MKAKKEGKNRTEKRKTVERVQTGIRMEKRVVKVLKALAEYHDMGPGELLEGILLHVFDGKTPFSSSSLKRIAILKQVYGLNLNSSDSHLLKEKGSEAPSVKNS
jgi:hypothetical protein